jgi:endogenous inhibitor of DNA gyrase (YacG/DUF329 family)
MQCPICNKPVQATDLFMPFCSDRCRIQDLANWASEKYVLPAPLDPDDFELEDFPPDDHE